MVKPMGWSKRCGTLLIACFLTVPLAAGHEAAPETPGVELTYFLGSDGQGLTLSVLPPSAANATTWTTVMRSMSWSSRAPDVVVPLELPAPPFEINETPGYGGQLRAMASCASTLPSQCGSIGIQLWLVEGERSVALINQGLSGSMRTFTFAGDYPGHGKWAGPHTHGNGSDADRGLYTTDIHFELRFVERPSSLTLPIYGQREYRIHVGIDGHGFATLWGAAPVPTEAPEADAEEAGSAEPPAEAPPEGNQTGHGGNATSNATASSHGGTGPQSLDAAEEDPRVAVPGPGLLGLLAAAAFGGRLAVKRRPRRAVGLTYGHQ